LENSLTMFKAAPQEFIALVAGAFVLGWLVAKIGAVLKRRAGQSERDPRDDRIRSLEAEHRIATTDAAKLREQLETLQTELKEARESLQARDGALEKRVTELSQLREDLKDSVKKTRELRAELQDRATENVRSEVKLREIETELEVTRASSDLIATGVLDYSMAPDPENGDPDSPPHKKAG
jgi:hypothetical protein